MPTNNPEGHNQYTPESGRTGSQQGKNEQQGSQSGQQGGQGGQQSEESGRSDSSSRGGTHEQHVKTGQQSHKNS